MPFPTRKKTIARDYSKKNLIDTTEDKFAKSPGLKHWADIQNLKIAAASYSQAGSISELEKQIVAKSTLAKTARTSLVETEHQLKDLGQILKYAEQYKANRVYHIRYQKSKDKDRYLHQHETELLLHDGAENMLKRFGIDTRSLMLQNSAAITMRFIPKRNPCGKPVSLPKRTLSPLPGNWITLTNILTGLRRSRKPPTGSPIKADNLSKFDIKKVCISPFRYKKPRKALIFRGFEPF